LPIRQVMRLTEHDATGFFLAGVYPPALKLMATWFQKGRGTALGILVGAIVVGQATPHLVNALGGLDWRIVIHVTSVLTLAGGLLTTSRCRGTGFSQARLPGTSSPPARRGRSSDKVDPASGVNCPRLRQLHRRFSNESELCIEAHGFGRSLPSGRARNRRQA
jgi:MFS family permease